MSISPHNPPDHRRHAAAACVLTAAMSLSASTRDVADGPPARLAE